MSPPETPKPSPYAITGGAGPEPTRRILVLGGGGYMGLFTAELLALAEAKFGRKTYDVFDFIVGTSAGALMGLALSTGKPAAEVARLFIQAAPKIFLRRWLWTNTKRMFVSAPYSSEEVNTFLGTCVDETVLEIPIRNSKLNFGATAIACGSGKVVLFSGGPIFDPQAPATMTVRDAVLASAAAPTFFPARVVDEQAWVDGGIAVNNPDTLIRHLLGSFAGWPAADIRFLTIAAPLPVDPPKPAPKSAFGWIRMRPQGLIPLMMMSQQQLAKRVAAGPGTGNALFIQPEVLAPQSELIRSLDTVSKETTYLLQNLAKSEFSVHEKALQTLFLSDCATAIKRTKERTGAIP